MPALSSIISFRKISLSPVVVSPIKLIFPQPFCLDQFDFWVQQKRTGRVEYDWKLQDRQGFLQF